MGADFVRALRPAANRMPLSYGEYFMITMYKPTFGLLRFTFIAVKVFPNCFIFAIQITVKTIG